MLAELWKNEWNRGNIFAQLPAGCVGKRNQFSLVAQSHPTLCDPMDCSTPGLPVHHQLPELAQTHAHRVGDAIQPPHPLSYPSPPAFNLSQLRVFSNESALCIRWSFSFSISPSNEHPGLISFRMDWLDLLAVQGTLRSLLQHHSSKASLFRLSVVSSASLHWAQGWLHNLQAQHSMETWEPGLGLPSGKSPACRYRWKMLVSNDISLEEMEMEMSREGGRIAQPC